MNLRLPTDDELRRLDDALADEGRPATTRPDAAMWRWISTAASTPIDLAEVAEIAEWFVAKFAKLHPSVDYQHRPFSYLCISTRGISYEINSPVVFGTLKIDPIKCAKIHQDELRRIHATNPEDYWELYYQAADAIDLFLGDLDLHPREAVSARMLAVGTGQLESAARQLVACVEDPSLAQAACLAAELTCKAVLHERGYTLERLKGLGHEIVGLYAELVSQMPGQNDQEVALVSASMPNYVAVRYSPPLMNIKSTQDLYRRALFLCAEALRRPRHDNMYYKLVADGSVPKRRW